MLRIDHTTGAVSAATGAGLSLASTWQGIASDPTVRVVLVSTIAGFVGVILRMLGVLAVALLRRGIARLSPSLAREIASQPPPAGPQEARESPAGQPPGP